MQRPPELGLPEDRKKDSDKSGEKADKILSRSEVVKEIKDRSFKTVNQVHYLQTLHVQKTKCSSYLVVKSSFRPKLFPT